MIFPVISQDKANHFFYGQLIFGVAFLVCHRILALSDNNSLQVASILVALVAFGKEAWDRISNYLAKRNGSPLPCDTEAWDAMATMFGGVSLWVFILFVRS